MGRHAPEKQTERLIDQILLFLAGVTAGAFGVAVAYSFHPNIADWSSRIIIGATIAISGAILIAMVSVAIVRSKRG